MSDTPDKTALGGMGDLLDELSAEFYKSDTALEEALSANASLREINQDLRDQLEVAKRVFGDAFVKAQIEADKGPSRPNRKKLTEREVKDIRQAHQGGMSQKSLADNYGVNPATISRIVRRIYH